MDRKELIKAYKDTPRPMGVYRVRNTLSGQWFIGSSIDVPGMLNRVRFELEMGSHRNRGLQADWNESGPEAFVFETLDLLDPPEQPGYEPTDDLQMLEHMWAEKLATTEGPGYAA